MKIKIGDNNRIKKSTIGQDNSIKNNNTRNSRVKDAFIKIIVGVATSVIAGLILHKIGMSLGG